MATYARCMVLETFFVRYNNWVVVVVVVVTLVVLRLRLVAFQDAVCEG